MNGTLWGQDVWRDVWVCVRGPQADPVFLAPAYEALASPDNQEKDDLAWV